MYTDLLAAEKTPQIVWTSKIETLEYVIVLFMEFLWEGRGEADGQGIVF